MTLLRSKLERLGLRARLIAMVVGVVMLVVGLISAYFILQNRKALERAAERHIGQMQDDLTSKGVEQARQLALMSQRVILVMDPLLRDELVRSFAANDGNLMYAAIVDDAQRAVAHSNPAMVGHTMATVAVGDGVVTRELKGHDHVLEIIAPIVIGEQHWGSVVIGHSLAPLDNAIADNDAEMRRDTSRDLLISLCAALVLMALASFGGAYWSSRISKPLADMLAGVERIRNGKHDELVSAKGGSSEFVTLADAFNGMVVELRTHMHELERALGEAREASRLKSEFLANVSHELRTPLNAIVNVPTQLMKDFATVATWHCRACEKVSEGDERMCAHCERDSAVERADVVRFSGDAQTHRHFLGRLRGQAQHLLSVVNDLLDFSKLDAHMMQLQIGNFDVAHVVESTRESLLGLAAEKKLRLIVDVSDAPATCVGDEVRVAQVLINLIGNAIKFTPEGGEVRVVASRARHGGRAVARFAVIDSGIGIAPENLERVFESFRQVDGSQTRAHGGTGLGLAIAKQLVVMHGGEIGVESTVGRGSTFWFEIPMRGGSVIGDVFDAPVELAVKRARTKPMVMIIDDNEIHLEIARMILDKEGFETVLVADARAAVVRIRDEQPDLVILDVMMPEISGITVLQQLKASPETSDIPIFIASAYSSNRDVVERLGGLWLPKPWDGERLPAVLRAEFDRNGAAPAMIRAVG